MPAALVLFGDVIRSRRDAPAATAWLRTLHGRPRRRRTPRTMSLAPFEFTQGDELQGLLAPGADPDAARSCGRPSIPSARPDALGRRRRRRRPRPRAGDAAERPGVHRRPRAARDRRPPAASGSPSSSGDPATDELLDGLAPLLGELLADLTDRQREIAWPILVDGLRRSEAAERLGVSRATVSVAADRAHLRSIGELARRRADACSPGRRWRP